jgi:hypothetical protein
MVEMVVLVGMMQPMEQMVQHPAVVAAEPKQELVALAAMAA